MPGIPKIETHIRKLQGILLKRLQASDFWREEATRLRSLIEAGRIGSILSFHCPGSEKVERLLARGVGMGITASIREGYLRIALHGWHSEEDIEKVAEWMLIKTDAKGC